MASGPKSIRFSNNVQELLDICCERYGMKPADVIRYALYTVAIGDNLILPGPVDGKPVPVILSPKRK